MGIHNHELKVNHNRHFAKGVLPFVKRNTPPAKPGFRQRRIAARCCCGKAASGRRCYNPTPKVSIDHTIPCLSSWFLPGLSSRRAQWCPHSTLAPTACGPCLPTIRMGNMALVLELQPYGRHPLSASAPTTQRPFLRAPSQWTIPRLASSATSRRTAAEETPMRRASESYVSVGSRTNAIRIRLCRSVVTSPRSPFICSFICSSGVLVCCRSASFSASRIVPSMNSTNTVLSACLPASKSAS